MTLLMTDPWTDRLSEYVDEELAPAERRELDAHLATCDECRTTLSDLRQVVNRARSITDATPSADLWPGIAARLTSEPRRAGLLRQVVSRTGAGWRVTLSIPQLAAAAVLLIAVSGAVVWLVQARHSPDELAQEDSSRPEAGPGVTMADFADAPYDAAVADLQRVLKEGRERLDTATVAILEHNLAVIDQAIRDARAALAQDPSDLYLNSHLVAARQRKLELLRQASALVVEGS